MIGFNPYTLLGLEQNAPLCDIRSAFKRLMLKYHPDKQIHNSEARGLGCKIIEAYQFLSNPEKRVKYDAVQHQGQSKLTNVVNRALPAKKVSASQTQNDGLILQCEQCCGQTSVDLQLGAGLNQIIYVSCEHCGLILSLEAGEATEKDKSVISDSVFAGTKSE